MSVTLYRSGPRRAQVPGCRCPRSPTHPPEARIAGVLAANRRHGLRVRGEHQAGAELLPELVPEPVHEDLAALRFVRADLGRPTCPALTPVPIRSHVTVRNPHGLLYPRVIVSACLYPTAIPGVFLLTFRIRSHADEKGKTLARGAPMSSVTDKSHRCVDACDLCFAPCLFTTLDSAFVSLHFVCCAAGLLCFAFASNTSPPTRSQRPGCSPATSRHRLRRDASERRLGRHPWPPPSSAPGPASPSPPRRRRRRSRGSRIARAAWIGGLVTLLTRLLPHSHTSVLVRTLLHACHAGVQLYTAHIRRPLRLLALRQAHQGHLGEDLPADGPLRLRPAKALPRTRAEDERAAIMVCAQK